METTPRKRRKESSDAIDPEKAKVVTIQYQQINPLSSDPIGALVILKEWQSSEKDILRDFAKVFLKPNPFDFVPIGFNLVGFDFPMLIQKFKKHRIADICFHKFVRDKPHIDIKPILILANKGQFKGCKLSRFTGKPDYGCKVPEWYSRRKYSKIVRYVTQECTEFLKLYRHMREGIPGILRPVLLDTK